MDTLEFREIGHTMIDMIAEYLEHIEDQALFPEVTPQHLDELFSEPLPQEPTTAEDVLLQIQEKLLPYCCHVNHPGYFGLITPTPTPVGILGDLMASALNQNLGAYAVGPSAVAMERRTVRWLSDLVGYDEHAGGNLTSGGTLANLIGLKLARDWTSKDGAQHDGMQDRWAVYVSEERHVSIDKAVDAVGAGRNGLRALPTDDAFRVRIDALEAAIAEDLAKGIRPMCIIGIAGTTNTGAVDPLEKLREISDRIGVWFHVDAAYGGGVILSEKKHRLLGKINIADSITMDPHKWFYAPLDAGAILVKDGSRLTTSFGMMPPYLTDEMDAEGERYQYYVHGFEQSRRFRGLKVWMSFKRYGARQIGRWVDANIEQAEHMYAICIRYQPGDLDEEQLDQIHREVVRRIEKGGRFWISTTVLKGQSYFRINPVNFRTRASHMEALLEEIKRECESVRSLHG
jgi:aromatic-L-amino-acid decarboxylase